MEFLTKIPGYKIELKIGSGGMSTVYLAIQEALERTVALKIMAPSILADPSAEERFFKEGKTIARLNHPNIVTVHDIGCCELTNFMVMEYFEGGNLVPRIQQGLTIENTFDICKQIAAALGYAHKRGYIHRDVKPANILFREDGTAVLSDFGIAKALTSDTALTVIGQTIGTPAYMSPEQITAKPLDSRCDLYSLGVVLYEMLTRQKPFKGDDAMSTAMRHLQEPVPQLPQQLSFCQSLINGLLAKNPDERIATVDQFIQILEDTSAKLGRITKSSQKKIETLWSSSVVQSNDRNLPRTQRWLKTKKTNRATGFGALAIVVGMALYWQMAHDIDPQTRVLSKLLLAKTERQMEGSQLTEPVDNIAYESYSSVLKLDPYNKQASAGMQKIASRIEQRALSKQQQEQYEQDLETIAQGLAVVPKSSVVLATKDELAQQLEDKRRQRYENKLLAIANHRLNTSRLIETADDNADAVYHKVLELDSDNVDAEDEISSMNAMTKTNINSALTLAEKVDYAVTEQPTNQAARLDNTVPRLTEVRNKLASARQTAIRETKTTRSLGEDFQDKLKSGGLGPKMVVLPAGNFIMGSTKATDGDERDQNERQHRVTIDKRFAIGQYEVTNAQYRRFRPEKDSGRYDGISLNGDDQPVVRISWNDAVAYAEWLSEQTGKMYRLPTEAEWEYAARAETKMSRYWVDDAGQADVCVYANVYDQSAKSALNFNWSHHVCDDGFAVTSPVGRFKPNAFKLYDMLGNVWEWTCSEYDKNFGGVEKRCKLDGDALRSLRGGAWSNSQWNVRAAKRDWNETTGRFSTIGFRLAQDI